jgi:hypothetical protein
MISRRSSGVHTRRQRSRANQVGKHHGDLPAHGDVPLAWSVSRSASGGVDALASARKAAMASNSFRTGRRIRILPFANS